jgi:hypothetical protein
MKSPPYLQPVPYPARTLDEPELFTSEGITEQNNEDKQKPPTQRTGFEKVTCKQET